LAYSYSFLFTAKIQKNLEISKNIQFKYLSLWGIFFVAVFVEHRHSEDALPMLISHCDNERLDDLKVRKIGF